MSLKHGLLGLLSSEGPTTGYELDKIFKNSLAYFWHAKTSQIYRELSTMESLGWLTSERVLQEEKPNKRVYSITDQGKEELLKWLMLPDIDIGGGVKSPFMMRIFLIGEAGEAGKEQALQMIGKYRESCNDFELKIAEALKEIAKLEGNVEDSEHMKYWKIIALHGEMSIKTAIEWTDKAIAILKEEENESFSD